MAGTKAGGAKAAATNKAKYGEDFYRRIGAEGGKLGTTGGFYCNRELARTAGAVGGRISRRKPSVKVAHQDFQKGFNKPMWRERLLGGKVVKNVSSD